MSIEINHISSEKQLEEIKSDWKLLDKETGHKNICSSYDWIKNWWDVFKNVNNNNLGIKKKLLIVYAYDANKLILVWPLMELTRNFYGINLKSIEFIGQQWSGIYYDIILNRNHEEVVNKAIKYLYKKVKFDFLYMRYLPDTSILNKYFKFHFFTKVPEVNLSNYESFDRYCKNNYSKGHMQNLRTGLNRIAKNKDIFNKSTETINKINFESIISISKSKLLDSKKWIYGDSYKREFYKRLFNRFNSNVVFIKINNINAAYRANLIFNNMKVCLDASYDRNFPRYELGIHSVNKNIEDSFEKKLEIHSLGPGLDLYKFKFTKNVRNLYFTIIKGNTILSIFKTKIVGFLLGKKYLNE